MITESGIILRAAERTNVSRHIPLDRGMAATRMAVILLCPDQAMTLLVWARTEQGYIVTILPKIMLVLIVLREAELQPEHQPCILTTASPTPMEIVVHISRTALRPEDTPEFQERIVTNMPPENTRQLSPATRDMEPVPATIRAARGAHVLLTLAQLIFISHHPEARWRRTWLLASLPAPSRIHLPTMLQA